MPTADSNSRPENSSNETPRRLRNVLRASPETVFLACLVAAGFLVRLWPVWQVHYWDEAVYLQNAEVICCGKINYSELSSRPPLLSLLFAGLFRVWHHVYAASVFTAALNAFGPSFLYLGGRRVVGRAGAAIAALLLAFSPFFVSSGTGNSLLTDSPALTLILISFWLLLEAAGSDAAAWSVLAGFVAALAVLMRFASLPAVAMISLVIFRADRWFWTAVRFGVGFALGIGPYLLWSRIRYGSLLATLQRGWENVAGSAEPTVYYLQNLPKVFPWITLVGLALWIVGWMLDKRAGRKRTSDPPAVWPGRRAEARIAVPGAYLWAWALAVLAYFSAITHKELRYILPLAPPVCLLAGRGLTVLVRGGSRKVRALGAAVLVAALGYSFSPVLERFHGPFVSPFVSEEKDVSDFLNSKARPGAVLYTNFNYPVFGYYTSMPMRVLLEEDARFYEVFPRNMPSDGYLILYKQVDKAPSQDWVESNPDFRRFQEFPSLVVYEYQARAH